MKTAMKYASDNSLPPKPSATSFLVKGDTVYDFTYGTHVMYITENLAKFDLNKKEVGKVYRWQDEMPETEGAPKEALVRYAASRGWIRVRHYRTPKCYWSIQCDATEKRRDVIGEFIAWAVANKIMDENDPAVILGYDNPNDLHAFTSQMGGIKMYLAGTR
jgi:hypothetical protein